MAGLRSARFARVLEGRDARIVGNDPGDRRGSEDRRIFCEDRPGFVGRCVTRFRQGNRQDPFFKSVRLQHHLNPFEPAEFGSWVSAIFGDQERKIESAALSRLFGLTDGVTEDLVAVCAEIWVQNAQGRSVAPADVKVGWRNVVANPAQYFLHKISTLSGLQSRILRYAARNPRVQPFAEETLSAVKSEGGPAHRALRKLVSLELLREEERDGRKRVSVHDARLAFYLRA